MPIDDLLFSRYTINMSETDKKLITEGWALFTRLFLKYDSLEKTPIDLGGGEKLTAAQVHTIEAVGKGFGETVTGLSEYFKITKGAVSQVVNKLHDGGYLLKIKRAGNDKEILLELTDKGKQIFDMHEQANQATLTMLEKLAEKYSEQEIKAFLAVLGDVDQIISQYLPKD